MALSVEHREHLERLIECAVCMDITNDPRRLPCGHSFCFSCLQGLWNSSQPTSKVRCPQCRKDHWLGYEGPKTIPKDFIIEQIKDMLASMTSAGPKSPGGPRPPRCDFCLSDFPSTVKYMYCLNCDSLICSECSQRHRCSKGAAKTVVKLDFQCSLICNNHRHPVRYICDACNNLLCKRCQVQGVCGDHDLFDVFLGKFLNDEQGAKGGLKRTLSNAKPRFAGGVFIGLADKVHRKGVDTDKTKQEQDVKKPLPNKRTPPKRKEPVKAKEALKETPPKSTIPTVAVRTPKGSARVNFQSKTETVNIMPNVTCIVTKSTVSPVSPSVTAPQHQQPPQPPQRPPQPTPQPAPVTISPPVVEESLKLPWQKELSSKGRSVTILPSGDFAILTEKCVYLIDKNGCEQDSFSDIDDPWGITYWAKNGSLVISERRQRRLAVLTVSAKGKFRHSRQIKVNAKASSSGLWAMFKSPDAGPMAVAALSDGGLAVTTARVSGEAVTYLNEVIVYNLAGKEQYRWQCDPAPQGVTSVNSYVLLTMRNCVKVFTPDGTEIQQFGDKRLLFDPACLCPVSNQDVLVTHRKSYICDNVSVWRISKWSINGQRQGHLVEMSEIEHGPLMGIMANENILIVVSENNVSCQDRRKLYLKRF